MLLGNECGSNDLDREKLKTQHVMNQGESTGKIKKHETASLVIGSLKGRMSI